MSLSTRRPTPPTFTLAIVSALVPAISIGLAIPSTVAAAPHVAPTPIATGFTSPVLVTHAGDGSDRLFVVEQVGRINIIHPGGAVTTFLDIRTKVLGGGERGLLGLAFHPSYETNRKFYVYFTRGDGDIVVEEYRADVTDPNVAVPSSARRVLRINHPLSNHNGGHLAFGPGGYLYIGTGDGGGAGDPDNNARDLDSLLGKLLRIDINGTSGTRAYRIPGSNPYVGRRGRNEIWARGFRNPWRFSFDRATRDLWIGDVGQSRWEEVDRARRSAGGGRGNDYGWRVMEGNHCYRPSSGCDRTGKTKPLAEYGHDVGCSITGGYVYRGSAVPALWGRYVFGDYCSGRVWTISANASNPASEQLLQNTGFRIASFGEDEGGELYLVDHEGGIYRFAP